MGAIEVLRKHIQDEQAQSGTCSLPLSWDAILELDDRVKALEAGSRELLKALTAESALRIDYEKLTPQPAQDDEALVEKIKQIIRDYHYALDTRQHGEVAMGHAVDAIMDLLGMPWEAGVEINRRMVRGQS